MKNNIIKATITEALPGLKFRTVTEEGKEILAHLAGKLRIHRIRVVPGDTVFIEVTPYDDRRGRITKRL
ncbi:MAG: translation initiation factor IF-1 [Candidatus Liptonbacteria bacterium CG11_big_fil_rev_8_21_14_0_20_35_14]|uniref:Translation initiation factor IF-1 n=1 Tax=Candidatus Liptonbacteria bacterium CG11_big_fil_rev_8_21_14_0_20_35_14 TaxID=1974634 RepID=A0A2H0N9L5_9BACT|nr:MAG: translation initiation factor IF-1 [Candidatus Liptonbacteria bacterium CG11_big_fil_rev_8_21_14_0_20_35_14]